MDRLKWLYQFVKHKIDNNERCDPNIYIVLSGGFTGNCQTGDLLVVIINKIRESAYLTKRVDYPNLVLVQYAESVPSSSNQIVFWTNPAYSEYAESQWKDLINLFDGPSVLNPFLQCDGFLTNQYGPERMRVDFNPTGHESKHRLFYDSIEQVHYNHFSTFQNLILLLFQAQHCDECLLIILNSLRTSKEIDNFVWKVGRGVWSPKEKRDMDRCIAWVDDNYELYWPRCWRYNLQEEVQPQTSHMTQNDIRLGQVLLPSPPPPTESPPYYNDRRDFVGNAQYHPQASVPSHTDPRISYNKTQPKPLPSPQRPAPTKGFHPEKVSTLAPPVLLQSAPEPSLKRLTDVIQIVVDQAKSSPTTSFFNATKPIIKNNTPKTPCSQTSSTSTTNTKFASNSQKNERKSSEEEEIEKIREGMKDIQKKWHHNARVKTSKKFKKLEEQEREVILKLLRKEGVEIEEIGFKTDNPVVDRELETAVLKVLNSNLALEFQTILRKAEANAYSYYIDPKSSVDVETMIMTAITEKLRAVYSDFKNKNLYKETSSLYIDLSDDEEYVPETNQNDVEMKSSQDTEDDDNDGFSTTVISDDTSSESSTPIRSASLQSVLSDEPDEPSPPPAKGAPHSFRFSSPNCQIPDEIITAYYSITDVLDTKTLKLPMNRKKTDTFCAFCITFHSNSNHLCLVLNDAEAFVVKEVNMSFFKKETAGKFDMNMLNKLKKFIEEQIDSWKQKQPSGERIVEEKTQATTPKKKSPPSANLSKSKGKPRKQSRKNSDIDWEPPVQPPSKITPTIPTVSIIDSSIEQPTQLLSATGRPLRATRLAPRQVYNIEEEVKKKTRKKKKKKEEPTEFDRDVDETKEERQKQSIRAAVNCGFRMPPSDYFAPPLPADKSQWTREDYRIHQFGNVQASLRDFRPDYLDNRSALLHKIEKRLESSDEEEEEEETAPSSVTDSQNSESDNESQKEMEDRENNNVSEPEEQPSCSMDQPSQSHAIPDYDYDDDIDWSQPSTSTAPPPKKPRYDSLPMLKDSNFWG